MIRHIVLINLKADAPPGSATTIVDALKTLPGLIPSLRHYEVGTDLGLASGNATVAATGTFDDEAGYIEYRDHPVHRAIIDEHIVPVRESRAAIQIEI